MAQALIAGRVPPDIKRKVAEHCQEAGINESQLVAAAVCQYLQINPPEKVKGMEQRLSDVERKLQKVLKLVAN
ncbi:hypothetical protein ACN4EG_21165 [Alkalinema pantanalense CENA528]|uniref:hypothetical protein n=1 Tax=Alkalinema pantanalense TaxID=1620705 RepID=UPI003D6EB341